jgi:hypothetical protein
LAAAGLAAAGLAAAGLAAAGLLAVLAVAGRLAALALAGLAAAGASAARLAARGGALVLAVALVAVVDRAGFTLGDDVAEDSARRWEVVLTRGVRAPLLSGLGLVSDMMTVLLASVKIGICMAAADLPRHATVDPR